MRTYNKARLGAQGMTETSAQYLMGLAKEEISKEEQELRAADFLTVTGTIITSDGAPKVFSEGKDIDYVNSIDKMIHDCGVMYGFCAWASEGIKEKERERNYWNNFEFGDWLKEVKQQEYPRVDPNLHRPTEDEIRNEMSIKEACEYDTIEALSATYGKFIHPGGPINDARKKLHMGMARPSYVEGTGSETIVFSNQASVGIDSVDSMFEQLQNTRREYEKHLNSIKASIKDEYNKRLSEYNLKLKAESERVRRESDELVAEYNEFIRVKLEETAALQIIIPEKLRPIYDKLNSLGKK